MQIPSSLFASYAKKMQRELSLLIDFTLPPFEPWVVDWTTAFEISKVKGQNKPWDKILSFKTMLSNKENPAIYFFTIQPEYSEEVYNSYNQAKGVRSKHRKDQNSPSERYFSYSHVPKKYKGSNCIYVGSVKNGLHGRLIHHLGFGEKGATGALYLHQIIKSLPSPSSITFHYSILSPLYKNVTKHIECVVQDELKPFIGKRAIEDFEPYTIPPSIEH